MIVVPVGLLVEFDVIARHRRIQLLDLGQAKAFNAVIDVRHEVADRLS